MKMLVLICVEINQSFPGDDAAVLARSSGEEPESPRHRAGVASMAWRTRRNILISTQVGTSSDGGGAKADAVGLEAWALTRCVWTTMGPDGGIGGARTGAKLFAT